MALGVGCRMHAFSSCGEQGLLVVEMPWLLIAFLAVERGLWGTWASGAAVRELSGRGTRA